MILLLLVSFVVLLIGYSWHNSLYWKRRGVNGPTSKLFIGNLNELSDIINNPIAFKLAEWTQKFGSVYGFQRGCRNALVLSDQKLAKEVFVDQFENFHERDLNPLLGNVDRQRIIHVILARGRRWKRLRTLISLIFTTKSLKRVFPIVAECSDEMLKNLEEDLKYGDVINIAQNLKEYSADVILRTAFGRHENRAFIRQIIESVLKVLDQIHGLLSPAAWVFPLIGPVLFMLNQIFTFVFNKFYANFFKQLILDINQRVEAKNKKVAGERKINDFIDLLIEAESNEIQLKNTENYDKKNSSVEKHLSKDEIIGSCIMFLIAGFDTTANTLAFTFYYLAKNYRVQEKARQEIKEHCSDENFNYDSLSQLKYLDAIIKETLRLNTIGTGFISRRCTKTTQIGNLKVEKGTDIILDLFTMHRDKNVWGKNANEYKPERWLGSNVMAKNFYGFGSGLRICAGRHFAQMEYKIALIKILNKYEIHEVPETKEAQQIGGVIMGPKNLKVLLEKI